MLRSRSASVGPRWRTSKSGRQKILLHHVYKLATALEMRSILDLIPNTLVEIEPVNFTGDAVSEQQKTTLEDFVRRIGKKKR